MKCWRLFGGVLLTVVFAGGLFGAFVPGTAIAGYYFKIRSAEPAGETQEAPQSEWIEIENFRLGRVMSRALLSKKKAGRVSMSNFSVIKYVDESSTPLYSISANGTIIPEIRLEVDRPHSNPVNHIIFTLKDVIITSVIHAGRSGGRNLERVNMRYSVGRYRVFPVEKSN